MCLTEYSKMEALDYDEFVRRIQKYRDCHIGILSFKRVLQSKWAVIGKIKIKIKTIGIDIPSTEKKKEANTENFPAVVSLPTTEHETLNDAKEAPEESNEGDIIKHEVDEVDEADEANDLTKMIPDESTDAEVNVTGGMEVAETRDAEGNAFKDLLKRESNVSEQEDKPTTDIKDVAEGEDVTETWRFLNQMPRGTIS